MQVKSGKVSSPLIRDLKGTIADLLTGTDFDIPPHPSITSPPSKSAAPKANSPLSTKRGNAYEVLGARFWIPAFAGMTDSGTGPPSPLEHHHPPARFPPGA